MPSRSIYGSAPRKTETETALRLRHSSPDFCSCLATSYRFRDWHQWSLNQTSLFLMNLFRLPLYIVPIFACLFFSFNNRETKMASIVIFKRLEWIVAKSVSTCAFRESWKAQFIKQFGRRTQKRHATTRTLISQMQIDRSRKRFGSPALERLKACFLFRIPRKWMAISCGGLLLFRWCKKVGSSFVTWWKRFYCWELVSSSTNVRCLFFFFYREYSSWTAMRLLMRTHSIYGI